MRTPNEIATEYLAAWNADNDDERRELLDGWSPDARYDDPIMSGTGRDGIATMMTDARAQFPGHAFTLRGTPDGHGAFVRFSWLLALHGKAAIAGGTDTVRLDDEGRIAEIIGFLDGAGS